MSPHSPMPAALLAVLLAACGDPDDAALTDGGLLADGSAACAVQAPTACPTPAPTYADIAPIVSERCVRCHDGAHGQWPLTRYQHLADWYDIIPGELTQCRMPPADSGVTLPDDERLLLLTWLRCGLPM
ncbi:MAG: hypothetical protein KC620_05500 [Myxococcales bacterium]|nr:hypothetical protein [Myxococcales bacterium]